VFDRAVNARAPATEALSVLTRWARQCDGQDRVFGVDDPKKGWVALLQAANIANFRFHDLRHHFASKLVRKGIDLNTARELLGHADITITLRYAHLAPDGLAATEVDDTEKSLHIG